jgi:hypothetical protein
MQIRGYFMPFFHFLKDSSAAQLRKFHTHKHSVFTFSVYILYTNIILPTSSHVPPPNLSPHLPFSHTFRAHAPRCITVGSVQLSFSITLLHVSHEKNAFISTKI